MDFSSALLSFLAGATVRSLVLAVVPLAMLAVWRVKAAATRHAVLLLATGGMLALAALNPLLPAIPLAVLRAAPAAAPLPTLAVPVLEDGGSANASPAAPVEVPMGPRILAAVYFAGLVFCLVRLLFGALFTRRLLAGARRIESDLGSEVYESSWIAVPLTVGWVRPRILLPVGWQQWEPVKLDSVLVHERNHIRRGDWAIALVAAVNRSLYWFNPLAWWLERRLATLAEQACDDAALLALGERESYAQALLDMATAVKSGQGRLVWDAMAMAKGTEVRMRIERILDESRQIPRALSRTRWLMLVACSLPLIYFTAAVRPVPASAQDQEQTPPAIAELLQHHPNLTPGEATQIEQYLTTNPGDLQARMRLILYYFSAGVNEPRLAHTDWLIANHPESTEAAVASQGITPRATSFNTSADYEKAGALWRQQAASHSSDDRVLVNAGIFFAQPGGDPNEAERLFLQARTVAPNQSASLDRLSKLYAAAILGTTGDPKFPNNNPNFGNRVRGEIENSTDGMLLQRTGSQLFGVASPPREDGRPLLAGTLNLNEHPLLQPARELGSRLLAQGAKLLGRGDPTVMANQLRARMMDLARSGKADVVVNREGNFTVIAAPPPPRPNSVELSYPGVPVLSPVPIATSIVEPEYPALARQARVQGTVALAVLVGTDGHPKNIAVMRGHPLLVQSALNSVKQSVYPPVAQDSAFEADVNFFLPPGSTAPPLPADTPRKSGRGGNTPMAVSPDGEPKPPVPERIKVGGNVQAANLLKKVDPVYPDLAKAAGIQGTVTLNVVIGKDGTVQNVSVVDGHPLLVQAAMTAVQQWTYKPTLLNGDPVEVATTVTVPFELQ